MISYSVVQYSYIGREIWRTSGAVGIVEKERIVHAIEYAAWQCPVDYLVMLFSGVHVIYVLRIVWTAHAGLHAGELVPLFYDIPDIAALIDAGKFTIGYVRPVHDDSRNSPHSFRIVIIPTERWNAVIAVIPTVEKTLILSVLCKLNPKIIHICKYISVLFLQFDAISGPDVSNKKSPITLLRSGGS